MPRRKKGALNLKQKRFCEEYVLDLNGTRAAKRAGYSEASAHTFATELLKKPSVQLCIAALLEDRSKKTAVSAGAVVKELLAMIRTELRHFQIDDHGNVVVAEDAPENAWAAVAAVDKTIRHDKQGGTTYNTKIKLWNKGQALDLLGKHLAMYTDKTQVSLESRTVDELSRAELEAIAAKGKKNAKKMR